MFTIDLLSLKTRDGWVYAVVGLVGFSIEYFFPWPGTKLVVNVGVVLVAGLAYPAICRVVANRRQRP